MRFRFASNTAMNEATNIAATDKAIMISVMGSARKSIATPKIEK
jgi:hypothetical protein